MSRDFKNPLKIILKPYPQFKIQHDGPAKSIPKQQDFLTGISTVPGYASFRHIENGSWYIQTLCRKVDELGDHKHFYDILTAVNYDVGRRRSLEDDCMTPILISTLSKAFYLPRRSKRS